MMIDPVAQGLRESIYRGTDADEDWWCHPLKEGQFELRRNGMDRRSTIEQNRIWQQISKADRRDRPDQAVNSHQQSTISLSRLLIGAKNL